MMEINPPKKKKNDNPVMDLELLYFDLNRTPLSHLTFMKTAVKALKVAGDITGP